MEFVVKYFNVILEFILKYKQHSIYFGIMFVVWLICLKIAYRTKVYNKIKILNTRKLSRQYKRTNKAFMDSKL